MAAGPGVDRRLVLETASALAQRSDLWVTLVRQLWRLVPRGWWRRSPFLPVIDRTYAEFRMVTMYGTAGARPKAEDVVTYLHWCKGVRR